MENKKQTESKNKQIIALSIIIIFLLILLITSINIIKNTKIELTQLSPQTQSQMMGYIIKTANNKIIVIDGGTKEDYKNLENKIQDLGGKIDYWFLTHPHKDHVGAFIEIVNNTSIEIEKIYVTLNELSWYEQYEEKRKEEVQEFFTTIENEKVKEKVEEVTLNQNIEIDNINCEILGIKNPEITENAINNSSMVIQIQTNNKKILFLADTGKESGEKLLKQNKEKLKSDIVQMAHHGQGGVEEEIYKQIQPKICLWPAPTWLWDNDIGEGQNTGPYKTMETRQWIEKLNIEQSIIAKDGDITVEI